MTYLGLAMMQYEDPSLAGNYNIGPDDKDCLTTGNLADIFCELWNKATGEDIKWIDRFDGGPHEAKFLKLNCDHIKETFGWKPKWSAYDAVDKTVEWTLAMCPGGVKAGIDKDRILACMDSQIEEYINK